MTRHASPDQLASLGVGEFRRRKAARIAAHVAVCTQCTAVQEQLADVPGVLAATPYPALPDTVYVQIEAALRIEMNQRLTVAPATEAGRRDLPARGGRQRSGASAGRGGWHLPGLSGSATRLVAAAGAVVLVGGGGYLLATNLVSGPATSSTPSSAALPAPTQPLTKGPDVTYGNPGAMRTVDSVSSTTNFVPSDLRSQALGAYHEAQIRGEAGPQTSAGSASSPARLGPQNSSAAAGSGAASRLSGCIDAVGAGRSVLLLDLAKYEGRPATIIVFAGTATSQAEVVVATDTCSATTPEVLARAPLGNL